MFGKLKIQRLKRCLGRFRTITYYQPIWKITMLDGTEEFVHLEKYTCRSNFDDIFKTQFMMNEYIKIDDLTMIPSHQILKIEISDCNKHIVHVLSFETNRQLKYFNHLSTLEEVETYYNGLIEELKKLESE